MGQHEKILKLGEVNYLEKDYNSDKRCSCKQPLESCNFWSNVKKGVEQNNNQLPKELHWEFTRDKGIHIIDRRGG